MKSEIFKYLQEVKRSVKRPELLGHLKSIGFQVTDREMRATIEEMIVHDEYLIRSSEIGYCSIETKEEMEAAMKYLNAKAEAISIRKNSLLRNWRKIHKEEYQQKLF